jgi:hypothetical protein
VAEEDGRYLAHDLVRQLVRGQAVPAPGVGQGGLWGANTPSRRRTCDVLS